MYIFLNSLTSLVLSLVPRSSDFDASNSASGVWSRCSIYKCTRFRLWRVSHIEASSPDIFFSMKSRIGSFCFIHFYLLVSRRAIFFIQSLALKRLTQTCTTLFLSRVGLSMRHLLFFSCFFPGATQLHSHLTDRGMCRSVSHRFWVKI